jgi:hypothetical protein
MKPTQMTGHEVKAEISGRRAVGSHAERRRVKHDTGPRCRTTPSGDHLLDAHMRGHALRLDVVLARGSKVGVAQEIGAMPISPR